MKFYTTLATRTFYKNNDYSFLIERTIAPLLSKT